ncbi:Fucose permease [Actinacidiphila guanduensis]|uniref:Fucose permease n=1 Tax=Actinacidiphila guanduensis TaxID=310781 RepID=A0A1H0HGC6_9ACTN|nr:Fucose permease [Actinacidiphila guanduensis]
MGKGGVVGRALGATYLAFAGSGFAGASWAARIPQVKDRLGLDASALGVLLLAVAIGSLVALPVSGHLVGRFGSRRMVAAMAVLLGLGFVLVAVGVLQGEAPVAAGLFVFGFANGTWDVAMNVQGALVERRLGRTVMSRFHAGFSIGTVAGALVGAAAVALHVPVTAHLLAIAAVVALGIPPTTRVMLPDRRSDAEAAGSGGEHPAPGGVLTAWRTPRTLLIGLFVLAFAFAEGTGNDWIGLALIDGYHRPAALGTLAFAVFLAAMTAGRWFGTGLFERYGRVPVVRVLAVVATAGVLLFAFGSATPVAFAGAVLWGFGTSLGYPVGMSAGADDPHHAAAHVSVIASIGYCAFLGGPPLIGFLAHRQGVLHAITAAAALLAVSALIASAVRAPAPGPHRPPKQRDPHVAEERAEAQ